jgi:hypothetical protein
MRRGYAIISGRAVVGGEMAIETLNEIIKAEVKNVNKK